MSERQRTDVALNPLESIESGKLEDALWVSFGFRSEQDPLDVLHLVCAIEPPYDERLRGLYFEHLDQDWSGYRCARRIEIREASILFQFTPAGAAELQLPKNLKLMIHEPLPNLPDARRLIEQMGHLPDAAGIIDVIT